MIDDPTTPRPLDDTTPRFAGGVPMSPAAQEAPVPDTLVIDGRVCTIVKTLCDTSGEAAVYLVDAGGTPAVLKLYRAGIDIDPEIMRRVAAVQFDMIVPLRTYGRITIGGTPRCFSLMDYLSGGTLRDLRLDGDIETFRRIALQSAAAIAACHASGLVHGDVKPSNLLFRDESHSQIVLCDFGIATLLTDPAKTADDYAKLGIALKAVWEATGGEDIDYVRQLLEGLAAGQWDYDTVEQWFERGIGDVTLDMHKLASALLSEADNYIVKLRNPKDELWDKLRANAKLNVERMQGYFAGDAFVRSSKADQRKAVLRVVYEIDPRTPFFPLVPSDTIAQIVQGYGRDNVSDDEWQAITDGRLMSWLYGHDDEMAAELVKIMTKDAKHSRLLAYEILYNLDRGAAYDLRSAATPEDVGKLLRADLMQWQGKDETQFAKCMRVWTGAEERFHYYAKLHGWYSYIDELDRCFDLESAENRERLGAYDLRTAAYRACLILGATPFYALPSGARLEEGSTLDNHYRSEIIHEIHGNAFAQWLSVFFHENPFTDFSEPYSYERSLERWVNKLGMYDNGQTYYKRYQEAKAETTGKWEEVRRSFDATKRREGLWRTVFYSIVALWIVLLLVFGIHDRMFVLRNAATVIGLPLGLCTALIMGTRAFFRGFGFFISAIWGLLGGLSAYIPILILNFVHHDHTRLFVPTIIAITLLYVLACHLSDFRREMREGAAMVGKVLDEDVRSTLIEPLYYTFKTRRSKYKGGKFDMFDDAIDRIRGVADESVMHYVLWSLMAAVMTGMLILSIA